MIVELSIIVVVILIFVFNGISIAYFPYFFADAISGYAVGIIAGYGHRVFKRGLGAQDTADTADSTVDVASTSLAAHSLYRKSHSGKFFLFCCTWLCLIWAGI